MNKLILIGIMAMLAISLIACASTPPAPAASIDTSSIETPLAEDVSVDVDTADIDSDLSELDQVQI